MSGLCVHVIAGFDACVIAGLDPAISFDRDYRVEPDNDSTEPDNDSTEPDDDNMEPDNDSTEPDDDSTEFDNYNEIVGNVTGLFPCTHRA